MCRVAKEEQTVRNVLIGVSKPGRRSGAVMLVDRQGKLSGIFTDSDLARLFESRRDAAMDQPIRRVMSLNPTTIPRDALMNQAIEVFVRRKISELPVVDQHHKPCGLIDITDVVEMLPRQETAAELSPQSTKSAEAPADRDVVLPFPNQHGGWPRSNP